MDIGIGSSERTCVLSKFTCELRLSEEYEVCVCVCMCTYLKVRYGMGGVFVESWNSTKSESFAVMVGRSTNPDFGRS